MIEVGIYHFVTSTVLSTLCVLFSMFQYNRTVRNLSHDNLYVQSLRFLSQP